jgi:hypothetical protein
MGHYNGSALQKSFGSAAGTAILSDKNVLLNGTGTV